MKKKEYFKIVIIFFIVVNVVYWMLNFVFFQGKAPSSKAGGETIDLTYDPTSINSQANTDFTVTLKIKPSADITLRGYRVRLIFDKTKLNAKKIEYKLGTVSNNLGDTDNTLTTVNQIGILSIIGEDQTATGKILIAGSTTELVKLTFNNLTSTGTSFKIDKNDFNFYAFNNDMVLSEVPLLTAVKFDVNGGGELITPTIIEGTPASTNDQSVSGNIKLNLKLKYQGIEKSPIETLKSMDVKVRLKKEGTTNTVDSQGTFVADANGIWTGQVGFNINDISGKWLIYIKGPQHLQKKICDSVPTEDKPGTYRCSNGKITLTAGLNNFDLSKIIILVGDLDQSGVVDSIDFSLIRNNLGKTEKSILTKADLNRDGRVDTQDFSLILAALSIRTDEF